MKIKVNGLIGMPYDDMVDYNESIDGDPAFKIYQTIGIPIQFTDRGWFNAKAGQKGFITTAHGFSRHKIGQRVFYKIDFENHIWEPIGTYIRALGDFAIVKLDSGIDFENTNYDIATKKELYSFINKKCYAKTWQTELDKERENVDKCILNAVPRGFLIEASPEPGENRMPTFGDSGGNLMKNIDGKKKILGVISVVDKYFVQCLKAYEVMNYFNKDFKLYKKG